MIPICRIFFLTLVCTSFFSFSFAADQPGNSSPFTAGKFLTLANGSKIPRLNHNSLTTASPAGSYRPNEAIIKFRATVRPTAKDDLLKKHGLSVKRKLARGRWRGLNRSTGNFDALMLIHSRSLSAKEIINRLKHDPQIEAVSLNYIHHITAIPDDPSYPEQWSLDNTGQTGGTPGADISAEEAWNTYTGTSSPVTAVIDTGVRYEHPDLTANMWVNEAEANGVMGMDDDNNGYVDDIHGYDFAYNDGDPAGGHPHGTHVAGIIAATGDNGIGIAGVNWTGRILAIQIFDDSGNADDASAIEALNYVLTLKQSGVNIVAINASFGGGGYNQIFKDAIDEAGAAGIIFVAAAGNDRQDNDITPFYPSSYTSENIISVANTDHNDNLTSDSCYGSISVDLGAPGKNILSTFSWMTYIPDPNTDNFADDFESGQGSWISTENWQITEEQSVSPTHAWSDSTAGNSPENTTSSLYTPEIDLSTAALPLRFGFNLRWDLETNRDYLYISLKNKPLPGSWQVTTETARTGSSSWSDSPAGEYADNEDNRLISQSIDLSGAADDAYLEFYFTGITENAFDYFEVYMSGDDGATWKLIQSYTGDFTTGWQQASIPIKASDNSYDFRTAQYRFGLALYSDELINMDGIYIDDITLADSVRAFFSDSMESGTTGWATQKTIGRPWIPIDWGISGTSSGIWYFLSIDLNEQNLFDTFQVKFDVATDNNGTTLDGVYIDDFSVGLSSRVYDYLPMSGTSMSAPHVAGAVALLAARYPTESMADRINYILDTVDHVPALDGKAVTGGRLNLARALKAPRPFPWWSFWPAVMKGVHEKSQQL